MVNLRSPEKKQKRCRLAEQEFVRDYAFFDKLKGESVCLTKAGDEKRASSKNNSTYSLLDLFCFVASWSIFCSMRFERAMLTGCFRIVFSCYFLGC
jgi:hypothetical protein